MPAYRDDKYTGDDCCNNNNNIFYKDNTMRAGDNVRQFTIIRRKNQRGTRTMRIRRGKNVCIPGNVLSISRRYCVVHHYWYINGFVTSYSVYLMISNVILLANIDRLFCFDMLRSKMVGCSPSTKLANLYFYTF